MRNNKQNKNNQKRIRINDQIRAEQVRVISDEESLGVMNTRDALAEAEKKGLDLLEISPNAKPPVAKIADYGKYQYEQKKKAKDAKAKTKIAETKNVQVKIGTSEGDLLIKAKNISNWLSEGHRVKLDLFLRGRSKYMEEEFLKTRLDRVLHFVSESFKIADGPKKSPKGLTVILEKDTKKKVETEQTAEKASE